MTHFHYRTTFGNKTTEEIGQITGAKEGDTVFNTDIFQTEYCIEKEGDVMVWTNGQCVILDKGTTSLEQGDCCKLASGGLNKVANTSSDVENGIGVIHRVVGTWAVVAITGIYPVKFDETTSVGDYGQLQASPAGTCNGTTGSSKGTIGQVMQATDLPNGNIRLVRTMLTYCERD